MDIFIIKFSCLLHVGKKISEEDERSTPAFQSGNAGLWTKVTDFIIQKLWAKCWTME